MLTNFFQFALVTFTSVLFIVDPIAIVPTYLVITQGQDTAQRRNTAVRACIAAALLMITFAAAGRAIFGLFGITMPAFRIAGGLILWVVAMDMLHGNRTTQEGDPEIVEGRAKDDVAITPLAMPMLAGPGAISTVMVLSGQAKTSAQSIAVYGSIILACLIAWITLRVAETLVLRMGATGIRVLTRIMGLLLAAIAVQFVITGVLEAWRT
ncbi:MAG: multiple antibiotic resistance MarC-related protein [Gemmatimonadetes bacterium]|jgi:multiple antibiotic resistance protein|nr:multiple antibiotic resistance MarC-related protein [Gemmatimonadota bacterium]